MLWRVAVLPQALYGCELRDISLAQLVPLGSLGKSMLSSKRPLQLSVWRSPEALCGPPLGDTALQAPAMEMRQRQLQWLQIVINHPGLAGYVHRAVAWCRGAWKEPNSSLRSALKSTGWSLRRNLHCLRASQWPTVLPEESYPGTIRLQPEDSFPLLDAVFTDGSLSTTGGAAAVQPDTNTILHAWLPMAHSSTQCELAALCLAMTLHPPQVLTDSLCSLQLLLRWGQLSSKRVLLCIDRFAVRQVVHMASQCAHPPLLEKVLAHNDAAIAMGHPKSVGNDDADREAQCAANDPTLPPWCPDSSQHGDPIAVIDASAIPVLDVPAAFQQLWWQRHVTSRPGRQWLGLLYPADVELDWPLSNGIFHRPTSTGQHFAHPVPPAVIKWLARIRTGSLATRARRHKRGLSDSPACPCCSAPVEDDAHVVAGCPATGTSDWLLCIREAWATSASSTQLHPPAPPPALLTTLHLQLMAALIPCSLLIASALPPSERSRFYSRLHKELAIRTAELLGRREATILTAPATPHAPVPSASTLHRQCPLPQDRQLSSADLRALEQDRRSALPAPADAASSSSAAPTVPISGALRHRWMQERLMTLLHAETVPCAVRLGATSPLLLELFERVTGEAFTDVPGSLLTNRIKSLGRVLREVIRVHGASFAPPLASANVRGYMAINRLPRAPCLDIATWKQRVQNNERYQAPPLRPRQLLASRDRGLAQWIRQHRYLKPVEIAMGESSTAMLLLWEVDNGRPWPSTATGHAGVLQAFTKSLVQQSAQDDELQQWFVFKEQQRPLAPGLPDSHQYFWPVQVTRPPPADPQGWYDDFVARWRSYLATLAAPQGVAVPGVSPPVAASTSPEVPSLPSQPAPGRRPRSPGPPTTVVKRRRTQPATRPSPSAQPTVRSREEEIEAGPPAKRQRDIRSFFGAQPSPPTDPTTEAPATPAIGRHGRAQQGPPT